MCCRNETDWASWGYTQYQMSSPARAAKTNEMQAISVPSSSWGQVFGSLARCSCRRAGQHRIRGATRRVLVAGNGVALPQNEHSTLLDDLNFAALDITTHVYHVASVETLLDPGRTSYAERTTVAVPLFRIFNVIVYYVPNAVCAFRPQFCAGSGPSVLRVEPWPCSPWPNQPRPQAQAQPQRSGLIYSVRRYARAQRTEYGVAKTSTGSFGALVNYWFQSCMSSGDAVLAELNLAQDGSSTWEQVRKSTLTHAAIPLRLDRSARLVLASACTASAVYGSPFSTTRTRTLMCLLRKAGRPGKQDPAGRTGKPR